MKITDMISFCVSGKFKLYYRTTVVILDQNLSSCSINNKNYKQKEYDLNSLNTKN